LKSPVGKENKLTKNKKVEIVNSLTEEFKVSDAMVVCNYKGLTVPQLEKLRIAAKELDVTVRVIKNT